MWEVWQHPDKQRSAGSIEIDRSAGLVRKTYSLASVETRKPWLEDTTEADCQRFFENDVHWIRTMEAAGADFVPRLVDVDEASRSYVIPYLGPDLLIGYVIPRRTGDLESIGFRDQVVSHFKLYQSLGMYKYNHAAINHCIVGSRVMVIDFKWASLRDSGPRHRSLADHAYAERYAVENWMVKMDPALPELLLPFI